MKTRAIVTLLLLAICTAIYASEDITDPEVYWRKTQEMNQMAERFKEDTGFTGEVAHSLNTMRLHVYRGRFSDIPFTADADTTAFRQACERIVEKILPYSPANRSQLTMSRITNQWGRCTTDYKQQVGGYQVEGAGYIMITYDAGRKHFSISDNTVDLPEGVQINIARDKAISIAIDYFKDQVSPPEHKLVPYVIDDLRFHNPNKMSYSLKYIIYLGDYVYYVDAFSGILDWDNVIAD
ncbi:MAG: hypothetical protein LHW56_00005 [Candidatus Cloacimonetes bacterium]|jgi:hypothetical protein|nr:hypothetical protein [Candidatus Cloacimonadota bacterium]MDY0171268.1 hypothetical protein [Candidatus Cloacimonadaceae bacterium]